MAKIIGGIDIERSYTFDEIMDMRGRGKLKDISLAGYCVRADADGMISFIPWYESTMARQEAGRSVRKDISLDMEQMRQDVEHEFPMVRRTPQQRVAAMVIRLMGEAKRAGTIAGLSDDQIRSITGEAWKTGETQVTEAMVRKIAAHFLGVAEIKNREADSRRPARLHPLA